MYADEHFLHEIYRAANLQLALHMMRRVNATGLVQQS